MQSATLGNARYTADQCRINLPDGSAITVFNSAIIVFNIAASGLPRGANTDYRDFVRGLHVRIALQTSDAIRFTAGMAP